MNIKTLRVRHARDRFEKPLAILENMPGEGMEAYPEQLRQLAAALAQAAAECEARDTRARRFVEKASEYPLVPGEAAEQGQSVAPVEELELPAGAVIEGYYVNAREDGDRLRYLYGRSSTGFWAADEFGWAEWRTAEERDRQIEPPLEAHAQV